MRYDVYGRNSFLTGSFPDYSYTGRERSKDSPGLYFYRARYYWPNLGRFIQRDPLGYGGGH
ncbi:MAG: RHS repeat-associated core domain-containing protein [Candidatus Paceibacterota bacterium]